MSLKKSLNNYFIVVSILALVVAMGFFSYFSRQIPFRLAVATNSDNAIVVPVDSVVEAEWTDPFITPGPGAEKLIFKPVINDSDPVLGDGELSIVEFSDFSCKFCAEQEKIIKEVIDEYRGKIKLIWKDFPDYNSASYQASLTARCADEQGAFWSFHDFLFDQGDISSLTFSQMIEKNNLNKEKFLLCLESGKVRELVDGNIKEAGALRLPGVPFFFIGKQEILGAVNKEDLKKIIDEALYDSKN